MSVSNLFDSNNIIVWPVSGTAIVGPIPGVSILWLGAYSSLTTYVVNDAVSYSGSSYISIQNANLNNQPDISPLFWDLMAASGADITGTDINVNSIICTTSTETNSLQVDNLTTGVLHSDVSGNVSSSLVVDSDITNATITNAKLATASSGPTINYLVVRDAVASFEGNVITANQLISNTTVTGTNITTLENQVNTSFFTVYVEKWGNDTTGTGSMLNPYLTIAKALSVITTNDENNQFTIMIGPGNFTELTQIALKPWVFLQGQSPVNTIISIFGGILPIILDVLESWNPNSPYTGFSSLTVLDVPVEIDFQQFGISASNCRFTMQNCTVNNVTFLGGKMGDAIVTNNCNMGDLTVHTGFVICQGDWLNGAFSVDNNNSLLDVTGSYVVIISCKYDPVLLSNTDPTKPMTCIMAGSANNSLTLDGQYVTLLSDSVCIPIGGIVYTNGATSSQYIYANDAHCLGYTSTTGAGWTSTFGSNPTNLQDALDLVGGVSLGFLPLSGGTMSGNIDMGTHDITNGGSIVAVSEQLTGLSTGVVHSDVSGNLTSSLIVDGDITNATISDTKLATISTAGKVDNSATTATSSNIASTIVLRDISGNFSAGTMSGHASDDLALTGGTMLGLLNMGANNISNIGSVTAVSEQLTGLSTGVVHSDVSGNLTSSLIVNADITNATITDAKLATISTAGKVDNSATTATSSNTASAIVARDASNNFSAGTITASLTGASSLNVLKSGDTMSGNLAMGSNNITGCVSIQNTAGVDIQATNTNDNAASGYVGEYITASLAGGSAITVSQSTATDVTSISLTAGDWDIYGHVAAANSSAVLANYASWTSLTSATLPANGLYSQYFAGTGNIAEFVANTPYLRVSIAATTTVYLSVYMVSTGGVGTNTSWGSIFARRVR